ncbi:MAG TPA: hypothetical protein VGS57_01140 [Thermoanaerobaculia bacterium]|nr:hypothetical protein [Thermoanaerobaculia bacterium]
MSEDSAADLMASRAGETEEDRESIARHLRYLLAKKRKAAPPQAASKLVTVATPGLGMLLETLSEWMKAMDRLVPLLTTAEQQEVAAEKAAKVRRVIEARIRELSAVPQDDAVAAAARLLEGGVDDSVTPAGLVQSERDRLDGLLDRVRDLQGRIDTQGPIMGWREF